MATVRPPISKPPNSIPAAVELTTPSDSGIPESYSTSLYTTFVILPGSAVKPRSYVYVVAYPEGHASAEATLFTINSEQSAAKTTAATKSTATRTLAGEVFLSENSLIT